MSFNYVVTSQRPTAVSHATICSFTGPDAQNLILSKGNRIEVHAVSESGVSPVVEFGIYGNVSSLNYYRPAGMQQDVLFILTAKKYFCVLSYDSINGKIVNRAMGCVRDRIGRDSETGPTAFLDPDHRMIAMSLYERHLKIIPIEANGMREAYNVRVEELKPIDAKFLHGCEKPTLCLLHEDNRGCRHLSTYLVDSRAKVLTAGPWKQRDVDPETTLILPVQAPMKGVMLFAKSSISYVSGAAAGSTQTIGVKPMFVTALSRIDARGTRYVVGDDKGNLFVLVLICSGASVTSIALEYLGSSAISTSLCYLGHGLVFVGSSLTDSQLVRLRPYSDEVDGPSDSGRPDLAPVVEVLSTYMNIGPILDMAVVKSASNGQAQVVTCSGALGDGSLRVVRSGIGLHEQASIEIDGIKRMWSLRANDTSPFDTSLVQSFSRETRILSIEEEELSEGFIPGFKTSEPTLYCGNLLGNLVVQVTTSEVVAVSRDANQTVFTYSSPSRITVAEGNMRQLVIATSSSEIIYFECNDGVVSLVKQITLDHDVACMSMKALPFNLSEPAAAADMPPPPTLSMEESALHPMGKASVLAVGMWTDGTIRLLSLPALTEVARASLGTDVQVRDLLVLHHADANGVSKANSNSIKFTSFLLAGLGDGCVVFYTMGITVGESADDETTTSSTNTVTAEQYPALAVAANYNLHSRRRVVLGTRPISLSCFLASGNNLCAFAACDRPTVMYVRNSQLQFSMVNTAEAVSMTPFHSEMFPDCLAISSESSLMVCDLDTIQKVHVEKVELEEDPHRICYAPNHCVYGVLSSSVTPPPVASGSSTTAPADNQWSSHQVTFLTADMNKFFSHALEPLEHGLSIICSNLVDTTKGDVTAQVQQREYVIVGTAFAVPGECEPTRGRILVFKLDRLGASAREGKGASVAVDYDNIDDHAMSVKEGDDDADDSSGMYRVSLISERETNGAVLSLAALKGRLVAGINSKLQLFKWTDGADNISIPELKSECGHHGHLLALLLKSKGDVLALGDVLQSITMVNFNEELSKLEEIARDFTCNYMRAIEIMNNNTFIGAEDNENIFFVHRDASSKASESGRLDICGEFHVGELINVFQHGTLSNRPAEQGTSESSSTVNFLGSTNESVLFGTVSGAIGTVLGIDEATYNIFFALQKSIQTVVHSIGGLPHADWRNFANDKKYGSQMRTIDGDLIEMFLELTPAEMTRVTSLLNDELCVGVGGQPSSDHGVITVEMLHTRVEDISRCH